MKLASARQRMRARAARSPTVRKLAGKPPLSSASTAGGRADPFVETIGNDQTWAVAERYEGAFALDPISYGTVRDFADSVDQMPELAGASFDMKDLQRCWTVKAILGNVERGSRILEIGAGEPLVAGMLSRLGYDVTVVDPYDGSGNGPLEFKRFQTAFPELRFVREQFPPNEPLGEGFSAIYSISVLEHVPVEQISRVIEGGRTLLAEKRGCSIHAVDHVLAGWGADEHREKLEVLVSALGLSTQQLAETIAIMERDPETYFVSAEAHNRWRGDLPYDRYTMRRIGSVNLFSRA